MSNIRSSQSRVEGWLLIVGKGKKADLVCISCTENHWARLKISFDTFTMFAVIWSAWMDQDPRIFEDPVKYMVERLVFLAFSSLYGAVLPRNLTKCPAGFQ